MNMMLFKHYQRVTHEIKLPASNVIKNATIRTQSIRNKAVCFLNNVKNENRETKHILL